LTPSLEARGGVRGSGLDLHDSNIEGFWSTIKRGIVGSFHKISRKCLPLYIPELPRTRPHRASSSGPIFSKGRIKRKFVKDDYEQAKEKALVLAKSMEADAGPGLSPPLPANQRASPQWRQQAIPAR
jgi:hypothetical protein